MLLDRAPNDFSVASMLSFPSCWKSSIFLTMMNLSGGLADQCCVSCGFRPHLRGYVRHILRCTKVSSRILQRNMVTRSGDAPLTLSQLRCPSVADRAARATIGLAKGRSASVTGGWDAAKKAEKTSEKRLF